MTVHESLDRRAVWQFALEQAARLVEQADSDWPHEQSHFAHAIRTLPYGYVVDIPRAHDKPHD